MEKSSVVHLVQDVSLENPHTARDPHGQDRQEIRLLMAIHQASTPRYSTLHAGWRIPKMSMPHRVSESWSPMARGKRGDETVPPSPPPLWANRITSHLPTSRLLMQNTLPTLTVGKVLLPRGWSRHKLGDGGLPSGKRKEDMNTQKASCPPEAAFQVGGRCIFVKRGQCGRTETSTTGWQSPPSLSLTPHLLVV